MKKKLLLILSVLLCSIILFGCGDKTSGEADNSASAEDSGKEKKKSKKRSKLGDYNVQFAGEIVEEDDSFIINGKSNLLPGSRLVAELWVSEDEMLSDTTELVDKKGKFQMELDHHQYGEAEIRIRFDFDDVQEDEIMRHYGEKGQKLEGPYIYKHENWDGVLKKAEAIVYYDPDGESDLTIKAPDWYDLPDDYGDPRIWIEVEDITEDGEYFYVHGRSNILEGAEISGKYGGNRDKTNIKPDGSFDLKIEYEYREDTNFVIEFSPLFQWNEIEEAYGAEGQKLVGDLVEKDPYADHQYIQKEIPWDK